MYIGSGVNPICKCVLCICMYIRIHDSWPLLLPVPSGSPEVVSFTPHENHPVLTLSWTPPEESALNGPLSGISYQVRYGMLGNLTTEVAISSSQTSGSGVQQYVLTNLEYGTTYAAQVAAVSSNGTGPWSNAITQVTVTISKCMM